MEGWFQRIAVRASVPGLQPGPPGFVTPNGFVASSFRFASNALVLVPFIECLDLL